MAMLSNSWERCPGIIPKRKENNASDKEEEV